MNKYKYTSFIAWVAMAFYVISLFFPYQIIISRWGDNDIYPPESQYVLDVIIPFLCLLFNIPLLLKLIHSDFKTSTSRIVLLAVGLLSLSIIIIFLLSSFFSEWYLTNAIAGIGAYLNLASAILFVSATITISFKKQN